jgi:hypothetical protein
MPWLRVFSVAIYVGPYRRMLDRSVVISNLLIRMLAVAVQVVAVVPHNNNNRFVKVRLNNVDRTTIVVQVSSVKPKHLVVPNIVPVQGRDQRLVSHKVLVEQQDEFEPDINNVVHV